MTRCIPFVVPTNAELGLPDFDDSVFGSVRARPGINYDADSDATALDTGIRDLAFEIDEDA